MSPADYVRRPPTVTAVQWDGSDSAAAWITDVMPGATYDGQRIVTRDALDREQVLADDVWVLREPITGVVSYLDADVFAATYEPAE
jgi:hypothetical protein